MTERDVRKEKPAEIGRAIFTQVSREFPATAVFQGTRIAQLCSERNVKPVEIGHALRDDRSLMTGLIETANAVHTAKEATTSEGEEIPVTRERLHSVIEEDFHMADDMMTVPEEERTTLLSLFPAFETAAKLAGRGIAETAYRVIAEGLIQKHQKTPDETEIAPGFSVRPSGLTVVRFT